MEKLFEAERHKTNSLIKQLDELNHLNTQLTMQNSDAKRRLVSLELVKYKFYSKKRSNFFTESYFSS